MIVLEGVMPLRADDVLEFVAAVPRAPFRYGYALVPDVRLGRWVLCELKLCGPSCTRPHPVPLLEN